MASGSACSGNSLVVIYLGFLSLFGASLVCTAQGPFLHGGELLKWLADRQPSCQCYREHLCFYREQRVVFFEGVCLGVGVCMQRRVLVSHAFVLCGLF